MRRMIGLISVVGLVAVGIAAAPGASAQVQAPATEDASAQAGTVRWGPMHRSDTCQLRRAVRRGEGAGGLRPSERRSGRPRRLTGPSHRPRRTVPRRHAGQPRRSWWLGSRLFGPRRRSSPEAQATSYDWIGFDPRGVGSSEDALSCIPDYFGYDRPNYVATTPQLEQVWLGRSQGYAAACARKNDPALLSNLTTLDSARDMDSIRQALGQQQINYYGFSYGTYLGQVYGTMFPERVRRMVLDSNVDPRRVWYPSQLDQDRAFDRNIKIFFDWIAQVPRRLPPRRDRAGGREPLLLGAGRPRRPSRRRAHRARRVGRSLPSGPPTYVFGWPDIAAAFAGWVHNGDWKPLKALYDSAVGVGNDNNFAVYLGVQCTDAHWPQSYAKWRADSSACTRRRRSSTWDNTWFNAPCLYWPAPSGTPVDIDGSKVQSALLLDETLDAATPFEGSLEVRARFPNSSLIARPGGTTHAASLSGDAVRRRPDRRLPRDRRCCHRACLADAPMRSARPLAQPVPAGVGSPPQPRRRPPRRAAHPRRHCASCYGTAPVRAASSAERHGHSVLLRGCDGRGLALCLRAPVEASGRGAGMTMGTRAAGVIGK